MDQTEELKNKFVAVLNKKVPTGVLRNNWNIMEFVLSEIKLRSVS